MPVIFSCDLHTTTRVVPRQGAIARVIAISGN